MTRKRIKKRLIITKLEKFLFGLTIFLLVVSPVTIVFSKATLSKVNYDVEQIKNDIADQNKINESLTMKINELASPEKIQSIAMQEGLSYNNNNIKTIQEG